MRPPILLLHGLGGTSDWWRRNIDAFASEQRVLAPDLDLTHGAFREIAEKVAQSLDEPVHLVGNSVGGHIALHVAALRPELVRSLVLVNATGIPFAFKPLAHLRELFTFAGARSLATMVARDLWRNGPFAIARALRRILRDDARPLMRAIRVPVLLVWGEHDPLVPLIYARQMIDELPQARLVVIPSAGHVPMWENPAAFHREVSAFLRAIAAAPPGSIPPGSSPAG